MMDGGGGCTHQVGPCLAQAPRPLGLCGRHTHLLIYWLSVTFRLDVGHTLLARCAGIWPLFCEGGAQADYNAALSDIRCDVHYEAFYNNYPEKQKLPPPLEPVSVPVGGRMAPSQGTPLGQASTLAAGSGGGSGSGSGLRRIDSDASVEDLIFRESRKMRPRSSTNLQSLALLREDSVTSLASLSRVPSDVGLDDLAYRASPFMDGSHYTPPLAPARLLPPRPQPPPTRYGGGGGSGAVNGTSPSFTHRPSPLRRSVPNGMAGSPSGGTPHHGRPAPPPMQPPPYLNSNGYYASGAGSPSMPPQGPPPDPYDPSYSTVRAMAMMSLHQPPGGSAAGPPGVGGPTPPSLVNGMADRGAPMRSPPGVFGVSPPTYGMPPAAQMVPSYGYSPYGGVPRPVQQPVQSPPRPYLGASPGGAERPPYGPPPLLSPYGSPAPPEYGYDYGDGERGTGVPGGPAIGVGGGPGRATGRMGVGDTAPPTYGGRGERRRRAPLPPSRPGRPGGTGRGARAAVPLGTPATPMGPVGIGVVSSGVSVGGGGVTAGLHVGDYDAAHSLSMSSSFTSPPRSPPMATVGGVSAGGVGGGGSGGGGGLGGSYGGSMAMPSTGLVGNTLGLAAAATSPPLFMSFSEVVGRIDELARDQHGCRYLQTALEEADSSRINVVFDEVYGPFVDLMTDPFANYLCQKVFEYCSNTQRLALLGRTAPALPSVSTNMHGTRAVQRMVECLSTPEQVTAMVSVLAPAAVSLMKDLNGNHVIQRCLHRMDAAANQFVYDAVVTNAIELATHRHGCCVMQRCMDYATPAQRDQVAVRVTTAALPLVTNAFGNYVVQYVLELNEPAYTSDIVIRLRGTFAELSMQKFSSNVVEKCLQLASRDLRRLVIAELMADADTTKRLIFDSFGNYPVQRALLVAESPQLEQLCEAIRPHLPALKASPYGKRIHSKIVKRFPKNFPRD